VMLELRLFFGSSVLRFVHLLRTSISWLLEQTDMRSWDVRFSMNVVRALD